MLCLYITRKWLAHLCVPHWLGRWVWAESKFMNIHHEHSFMRFFQKISVCFHRFSPISTIKQSKNKL